jgi:phosphoribosylformimino-5-aminoimidazole carboxamide ribotide isomerase
MSMLLYPAIDVRAGRVVRLRQGDYDDETRYGDDPYALAERYAAAGSRWLHLVDLDAARLGRYALHPLLRRIATDTGLSVQTGGGVRSADDVAAMLDAGAARVVVGSLAVREPATVIEWFGRFGADRITVALDTRLVDGAWILPVHGWTEGSGRRLKDALADYRDSPLRHLLCTDIARDGMLAGPNLLLYGMLRREFPRAELQASGGIRDACDLLALRRLGVAGAVSGKALLEGRLDLDQALAC